MPWIASAVRPRITPRMSKRSTRPHVARRQLGPSCRVSAFEAPGGAREFHLFVEPEHDGAFPDQLEELIRIYHEALNTLGLSARSGIFRRCFVSDAADQLDQVMTSPLGIVNDEGDAAAVSCIQQPPLSGRKIAIWAYHVSDVTPADKTVIPMPEVGPYARTLAVDRGEHTLLWTTQLTGRPARADDCGPGSQTDRVFNAYIEMLGTRQATLLQNTVRTWVFVQQVDMHYQGMVDARRELFATHGLGPKTHYIVSTGIEGRTARPASLITLDAVADIGLAEEEIVYIDRLDHLNRTDDYGVTFERAVRVNYADRSHVYVAGTASIGPDGSVLHVGNVVEQVERTLENISALLEAGEASLSDVAAMIVYLRDIADADRVRTCLESVCRDVPYAMIWAPVCRPTWLVEIEVLAIVSNDDSRWPRY
jgi:enamine deaminase RidA (YjgF/YER057c/UK114 family)